MADAQFTRSRLMLALLTASADITAGAEALFSAHGLTFTQFNVLRILRGAGPEGLPCSTIGQRMIRPESDITRLLDRLQKQRLVRRHRDAQDRRIVRACISKAGRALLATMDEPVRVWEKQRLSAFSDEQLDNLADKLVTLGGRDLRAE